jgi:ABC-type lipoprotein release transport system permease subunit
MRKLDLGSKITSVIHKKQSVLLAFLIVIMFTLITDSKGIAADYSGIWGIVEDEKGIPLKGVEVLLFRNGYFLDTTLTDESGEFWFTSHLVKQTLYMYEQVSAQNYSYALYALANVQDTPGFDYIPSRIEGIAPMDKVRIVLAPGASIIIEGDLLFVESENLPSELEYSLLDPEYEKIIESRGFPLIYGSSYEAQSQTLGLEHNHLIVPANEHFRIGINATLVIKSEIVEKGIKINSSSIPLLKQGDFSSIDIRKFSIPYNFQTVESLNDDVIMFLDEMNQQGFYVVSEQRMSDSSKKLYNDALLLYSEGEYSKSYDKAKEGFLELSQIITTLDIMRTEASISVYFIVLYMAITSTTIALFTFNSYFNRIIGSIVIHSTIQIALYFFYPGSAIISLEQYIIAGFLAIFLTLTLSWLLFKFLKSWGSKNIILSIFSVARRNIRKRQFRFFLTTASITLLVLSFVALTSFSNGYGLLVNQVSEKPRKTSILIRSNAYSYHKPIPLSQIDVNSNWLQRQPESSTVSPKVENIPLFGSVTMLGNFPNIHPIIGILGIEPSLETEIIPIENALISGKLPSENGIVLTQFLSNELELEIGNYVYLHDEWLRLDGVIDEDVFIKLKELDGTPYIPKKLVNLNPEGVTPRFGVEPCEQDEYVIIHISKALQIPFTGYSRLALGLTKEADSLIFAERLALERGYYVWSGSSQGLFFARLGNYIEGKGLPLLVPFVIVILNVVITMHNSIFERKKEMDILSSVGLNPSQISSIFLAESVIIGFISGGFGYLAGLGFYKGMVFFRLSLDVHQKISYVWSLAAVCTALISTIIGTFIALQGSTDITPSFLKRWRIMAKGANWDKPFEVDIPVKLLPGQISGFIKFTVKALASLESGGLRKTSYINVFDNQNREFIQIDFVYRTPIYISENFYTKNSLIIKEKVDEEEMSIKLKSYGDQVGVHVTGSLVRMIAMRWSISKH